MEISEFLPQEMFPLSYAIHSRCPCLFKQLILGLAPAFNSSTLQDWHTGQQLSLPSRNKEWHSLQHDQKYKQKLFTSFRSCVALLCHYM